MITPDRDLSLELGRRRLLAAARIAALAPSLIGTGHHFGERDAATGKRPPIYVKDEAPWFAARNAAHSYGFAAFTLDPGIAARRFHHDQGHLLRRGGKRRPLTR